MAMTGNSGGARPRVVAAFPGTLIRWECRCQQPPVLLGTYDDRGFIHLKVRDRYWHVLGIVQTVCPRCGSEHTLELTRRQDDKNRE